MPVEEVSLGEAVIALRFGGAEDDIFSRFRSDYLVLLTADGIQQRTAAGSTNYLAQCDDDRVYGLSDLSEIDPGDERDRGVEDALIQYWPEPDPAHRDGVIGTHVHELNEYFDSLGVGQSHCVDGMVHQMASLASFSEDTVSFGPIGWRIWNPETGTHEFRPFRTADGDVLHTDVRTGETVNRGSLELSFVDPYTLEVTHQQQITAPDGLSDHDYLSVWSIAVRPDWEPGA